VLSRTSFAALPALDQRRDAAALCKLRKTGATCLASLTRRQRRILDLVLVGHPSKNIAADLGISQRTVDNHCAAIMRRWLEVPPDPDPHSDCCRLSHKTARAAGSGFLAVTSK
jgi:DNA-directed RNA polymerase specialized sigma24 family protein